MSSWRRLRAAAVVVVLGAGVLVATASPGAAALPAGTYLIMNDASPGYCLRPQGIPVELGPLVGLVPCNTANNMLWDISPTTVGGMTLYRVRNRGNGGCLDEDNRGGRITYIAHVFPCHGGDSNPYQLWSLPEQSGQIWALAGLHIVGLDNSRDDSGGFGYRVNIWPLSSTYNAAQTFSLRRSPVG